MPKSRVVGRVRAYTEYETPFEMPEGENLMLGISYDGHTGATTYRFLDKDENEHNVTVDKEGKVIDERIWEGISPGWHIHNYGQQGFYELNVRQAEVQDMVAEAQKAFQNRTNEILGERLANEQRAPIENPRFIRREGEFRLANWDGTPFIADDTEVNMDILDRVYNPDFYPGQSPQDFWGVEHPRDSTHPKMNMDRKEIYKCHLCIHWSKQHTDSPCDTCWTWDAPHGPHNYEKEHKPLLTRAEIVAEKMERMRNATGEEKE